MHLLVGQQNLGIPSSLVLGRIGKQRLGQVSLGEYSTCTHAHPSPHIT